MCANGKGLEGDRYIKRQFTQLVIEDYQLSIAVYDIDKEVIFQWIR
ncbi:MAG: hypothetical protein AAF289_18505 [Cyanobacteria bacterium P01_A01_bin.135]